MTYDVWGWGGPADAPTVQALGEIAPFVAETTGIPVQEPFAPRPLQVEACAPVPCGHSCVHVAP